jgi:hypothetical protein
MVGPDGAWRFSGWSQPAVAPVVKFYGIKTLAKGRRRFELPDGTVIDFFMPHYAIKGGRGSGAGWGGRRGWVSSRICAVGTTGGRSLS